MSIIQKVNVFFKEVYVELRKTNWLSRGDVLRHTLIVLEVTVVVAFILGGIDFLFSETLKKFILK